VRKSREPKLKDKLKVASRGENKIEMKETEVKGNGVKEIVHKGGCEARGKEEMEMKVEKQEGREFLSC
jgi:hypothetical protein